MAATRVKLIAEEENPELKLRVYITGGGCGFRQHLMKKVMAIIPL